MANKNKYQVGSGTIIFGGRTILTVGPAELVLAGTVETFDDASDEQGRIGSVATSRDMELRCKTAEMTADDFQLASGYYGHTEQVGSATRVRFDDSDKALPEGTLEMSGALVDGTPIKVYFKSSTADPSGGTWSWDKTTKSTWDLVFKKNVGSDDTDFSGWAEFGDPS